MYAPSIDPALVTTPPYDVISGVERQRLEDLHPYNIISLILGAELPGDEPGRDRYARSAARLRGWIAEGILVPEDRPHLYAYRMDYTIGGVPGSSGGVIGALDLEPEAPPALLAIHRLTDLSVSDFSNGASLEPYAGDLASLVRHLETVGPGTVGVVDSTGRWTRPTRGPLDTAWLAGVLEAAGASVTYEHDIEEVAAAVVAGKVAFLLAPIPIKEVVDAALAGRVMPPKSTLFWPKPRTGLLLRDHRLG